MAATTFGSVFCETMAVSAFDGTAFEPMRLQPVAPLALHPAAHVLHYASACFEGLKAHRGQDGTVRMFRVDRHAQRMAVSAERLCLPPPDPEMLVAMIRNVVVANHGEVPEAPGALYLRPVLIGTEANIGAAAHPSKTALLYVLASPVGDYFDSSRTLTLAVETTLPRSTPQFGQVKTGANYAMALGVTRAARAAHDADQVLFAPGGDVQETGAANFLMIEGDRIITKALDRSFLHGVTRESILTLAADSGYTVEERDIPVDEIVSRAPDVEMALSGTAAVLASVGMLVHEGRRVVVGDGTPGTRTTKLRELLLAVQRGEVPDRWGWTRAV